MRPIFVSFCRFLLIQMKFLNVTSVIIEKVAAKVGVTAYMTCWPHETNYPRYLDNTQGNSKSVFVAFDRLQKTNKTVCKALPD